MKKKKKALREGITPKKEILFKASFERAMAHLRAHPEILDIVNDRTRN